jgi:hypothetical protein
MKAKVTLFKMRVKAASNILTISDIASWEDLHLKAPEYSDITRLPDDADMEDVSFSEIRVVNISVN